MRSEAIGLYAKGVYSAMTYRSPHLQARLVRECFTLKPARIAIPACRPNRVVAFSAELVRNEAVTCQPQQKLVERQL